MNIVVGILVLVVWVIALRGVGRAMDKASDYRLLIRESERKMGCLPLIFMVLLVFGPVFAIFAFTWK